MTKTLLIAVTTTHPHLHQQAKELASELGLDFVINTQASHYLYLLALTPEYLAVISKGKTSPFYIDFLSNKMLTRSDQAGFRSELIARAMGLKPRENPVIVDATAGLGRDSFVLATLGYQITMLERSPILNALLRDALIRAQKITKSAAIVSNMHLVHTNAIDWLPKHKADIVYLDPMFPERKKSASVKKEMVIMQELLGKDEDVDLLFEAALTCAKRRVVVKRPRLAANIVERAPNFSITGKSSRFDIYLVGNHGPTDAIHFPH